MSPTRLAREADEIRSGLERTRIELRPAHRVVDVLHRGRVRSLVAGAKIERDRYNPVCGHGLVAQLFRVPVLEAPGAAVALDQRRKGSVPARLEHARQQWFVAVAKVLDVFHVEVL